ncbi:hypothetical protein C5167_019417 [Papaver somniferum]|uniref:Tudor domain-containing protein n=1 Tax=Papaver somniferum TaxID=3469 RepID=A0A4Y7IU89_PAPSO|nr:hypothetical protein C5167_019417 [Papaver somniferum]
MAQKVQQQLREVGSKLENPPTVKDALIELLEQAVVCLSKLDQSPSALVLDSMQPCLNAMVKSELLKHQDGDVKLLVATCLCEITRITAPEAPYSDDILRDIFILIVGTFHGLSDTSGPSFGRRVVILETLAKYRSCVVMLDLECDDLVNEMFSTFFAVASDDHSESVLTSMQTIMVLLLDESEDIPENLLIILLSVLGRGNSDVSTAARRVGMKVIELCAVKLEPCIKQLLTDQLAIRLKAVKLLGDLFALPDYPISEAFQPLFSEFLKRLTDKVVEVRVAVVEHIKASLCDRLLDYDECVRKQVVTALCDIACHNLKSIPVRSAKLVAERLRDKSLLVKKYTMDRLAEIYRLYCFKCSDGSMNCNEYDWIPAKIVRCSYDKDFRSETIEMVLCESLFPGDFSVRDKVKNWVKVFSGFDKFEVKALEKIMEQKQRLQQEMQKYLSLRQMYQDGDATELEKKTSPLFRFMSRGFIDPAKAEEGFKVLDQLQDANMWKTLMNLTDPNTTFQQSCLCRDDLLRIFGEEHKLHDFMSALSVKCSFLLFNKEYAKELISEATTQMSAGDAQLTHSRIDLLVMVARFFPSLLSGTEEDLVNLLKEDNEIIKEGILHVLAKAGGSIREQLALTSSSVDLILERLCLEGSRRQAKYAVHALAAIAKDDGLMSLSVLYKRLVDMLEEKTHLPAILQSLGCIAQSAMPVFETREKEVVGFITSKILECSSAADAVNGSLWDERSELCSLKIYGIKTLVKSYLPEKDAHLRLGFDNLLGILKNVLTIGEISKDIKSSDVEKAHMKLASSKAVLRLSKHWDHKIPTDIFHLTIRTSEVMYPEAKGLFLGKVHQYIKDRLLDPKYACAFLFGISGCQLSEFKDNKHNLTEIIQMCHQTRARQLPILCDASPLMTYPEYILPYLVHALAHHSSCPNIDECSDVEAFETIYRELHLFLSVVVHGDEDGKSEDSVKKKKECLSTLIAIFESIKCSEDVLDVKKSINSHAICDLGVSIIKRLSLKQDAVAESVKSVPLPAALYKSCEKKLEAEYLAKEGNTWLAGDSVFAQFESLKLEPDEMGTEINEGEDELDAVDKDGNEISLRKVMKSLKSKGTRTRKVGKKKALTGETKKQDHGDDILGMVREINLDTSGRSLNADSGNIPSEEENEQVNGVKIPDSGKRKRGKVGQTTSVAAPKRRINSSANKSSRSRSTTKGSRKASVDDSHNAGTRSLQYHTSDGEADSGSDDKMPDLKEKVKPKTSDLLSSCLPSRLSRGFPSKPKGNGTNKGLKKAADITGETDDVEMDNSYELAGRNTPISTANSSMNSDRNLKRNVTGLAKCSLKDANIQSSEMIGYRIKVWWPIDKKYYKGVIQSYNAKKKKHEILYDDGEVEVLQLGRERWELISDGQHPRKRLKSSKSPPSKGMSAQKRKRTPTDSKLSIKSEKRSSSSGVRQKRAPKRSVKPKKIILPESSISGSDFSDAEGKENSDITPEPVTTSKFSDSEEKQSLKNHSDTEKSDKEEDSDSEENHSPDGDKNPIDEQGSDEERTDSEDRSVEKSQKSSTEVEETGKEVKSDSEVDSVAHETHKSSSEAEDSDKEEKSDSEMEEVEETQKSTEAAKEPGKQEESISEGTGVEGSVKGPTDVNKFDEEKPELQSRMEEDRENNPTDAEDSAEEVKPESQDSMEEDTEKNPTDAEKSDEEERPESQNGLDKDTEEGPTASGQSGEGEKSDSSKSDSASSGDSDNVPLSVWKRKAR